LLEGVELALVTCDPLLACVPLLPCVPLVICDPLAACAPLDVLYPDRIFENSEFDALLVEFFCVFSKDELGAEMTLRIRLKVSLLATWRLMGCDDPSDTRWPFPPAGFTLHRASVPANRHGAGPSRPPSHG